MRRCGSRSLRRRRVRWTEGHENWDVLVLDSRATPPEYLGYLRSVGVCYLVAGDDRVDFSGAVAAMGEELGIRCVLSTAGVIRLHYEVLRPDPIGHQLTGSGRPSS